MREDLLTGELQRARERRRLPDHQTRRALRERAGLSQVALARVLGVDPATVCRWENGDRHPGGVHLPAYLAALERLAREAV
jgi:DNA-binding transcriptional regulator YiaG